MTQERRPSPPSARRRSLSRAAAEKLLAAMVAEAELTSSERQVLHALGTRLKVALTPTGVGGAGRQAAREAALVADLRAGRLVVPADLGALQSALQEAVESGVSPKRGKNARKVSNVRNR